MNHQNEQDKSKQSTVHPTRAGRRRALQQKKQNKNSKKESKKTKKTALKEKRRNQHWAKRTIFFAGRLVRRTVLTGLLAASLGVLAGAVVYQIHFEDMVSENIREGYEIAQTISPAHFEEREPTVMKDKNGKDLRVFKERNYLHLNLQEDDALFEKVSDVTTAIEDARFYNHEGFDYLGVGVAVVNYVRGGDLRGASTLTQQLVKNTYLSSEQSLDRKITEAVIAQELENQFSKREILEFYVNDAYFGRGNYGLETAAHYYFGKQTKELSHAQIATLIAIPNNPTIYDPINNPENTIKRRNLILTLLAENGTLDSDIVAEEQEKELGLEINPMAIDNSLYDWAESFAINQTVEELMRWEGFEMEYWHETNEEREAYEQRYNDVYARHLEDVLRGGYVIETSIDPVMQSSLQSHIDRGMRSYTATQENGVYKKQAPAVVIDNRTDEVVAIVGGRSQDVKTSFNRAFQSARQPGSAIKPFLSYAPAFEKGLATGTVRSDSPIKGGPRNWYNGHRGNMTLRKAHELSVNTIAYNLLGEVGVSFGRGKLEQMEFRNLRPEDKTMTMAIGGWTRGASPYELASAFNTLANDGVYMRPTNVRRVVSTHKDEVIFDKNEEAGKRVYASGVGYVTLDMMQSTVDFSGEAYSFGYEYEAGKTGTTNDYREVWFVGGSPYYSMSLYVGDDNPSTQNPEAVRATISRIYSGFMREIHSGMKETNFHKPAAVVQQGTNLWIRREAEANPVAERSKEEGERLATIQTEQQERLKDLAYRIVHGLTLEQAEARERVAEAKVSALEVYTLNGSEDMTKANAIRKDAEDAIEDVVRDKEKGELVLRMNAAYQAIQAEQNQNIANREHQEALQREKERRERELERIAKEKEAIRIQQEEAQKRVEEEALKEDTEKDGQEETVTNDGAQGEEVEGVIDIGDVEMEEKDAVSDTEITEPNDNTDQEE